MSGRERVPENGGRVEDGAVKTAADEVAARSASDAHDTTVAAAHSASHRRLERDEDGAAVPCADLGDGTHHWRGAAGINGDVGIWRLRGERSFERTCDASRFAKAAVFGREDHSGAKRFEQVRAIEILAASRA